MMQTINSYIYDNSVVVQIPTNPSVITRNKVVYTRTINVYQGVDNLIKLKIQNQDQKPADVADTTLVFTIVDDYVLNNASAVFSTNVTISNVTTAIGEVVIPQANVDLLTREHYTYSISYTSGNLTLPAYVDDNWGASGQLQVIRNSFPA